MDYSLDGNPLKRSEMSVDERKQLVHELSKEEDNKLTNDQIINKLSKTVPEEKDSSTTSKRNSKRQRKNAYPTRFNASERTKGKGLCHCRNFAGEVILRPEGLFCKSVNHKAMGPKTEEPISAQDQLSKINTSTQKKTNFKTSSAPATKVAKENVSTESNTLLSHNKFDSLIQLEV